MMIAVDVILYALIMIGSTASGLDHDSLDAVVLTAQERWYAQGESPQVLSWDAFASKMGLTSDLSPILQVVVLPRLQKVECVLADIEKLYNDVREFRALIDAEWEVTALVPVHILGLAHEVFRGQPIMLQGWWIDNKDGTPHFASPETP